MSIDALVVMLGAWSVTLVLFVWSMYMILRKRRNE